MSYQVLARKYRSQSFTELVGQNHISQTLLNALKNDRLPHALLFTGLRGTGKTSTARILAKTLRCLNPQNWSPCNTCENCMAITHGSAVDVIEIDGASNNGVDDIRELRDNVMFMPTSGKYKIFIIDEVHMLSTSAFNALLKTLEEPPPHVIFMMATTEVHKIPQTILSRCQRFDFRRIPIKALTDHLKFICQQENIKITDKALWLIARQGDGSARDSITLLDQVVNFSTSELTEDLVSQILGLTSRSLVFETFEALISRKKEALPDLLQKLSESGVQPVLFLEELLRLVRHSLVLCSLKDTTNTMIDLPSEEIEHLSKVIQNTSEPDLHMLFDMGLKSLQDVSKSFDPFLVLEICILRMVQSPKMQDIESMLKREAVPKAPPKPERSNEATSSTSAVRPQQNVSRTTLNTDSVTPTVAANSAPKVVNSESLVGFVEFVKKTDSFLGAKINNLILAGVADKKIQFHVKEVYGFLADQLMQPETAKKVQGFIDSYYGVGYAFSVVKTKAATGDSAQSLSAKKDAEAESKIKENWMKDPRVQKAQEVFKATVQVIQRKD